MGDRVFHVYHPGVDRGDIFDTEEGAISECRRFLSDLYPVISRVGTQIIYVTGGRGECMIIIEEN